MRRLTTAILIALTLFATPAIATPTTTNLQTVTSLRMDHERMTRQADAKLKAGYMWSAARDYRSLQRGLVEELSQLHALSHRAGCEAARGRIDAQIERATQNLAAITESAQLIRVAVRMF